MKPSKKRLYGYGKNMLPTKGCVDVSVKSLVTRNSQQVEFQVIAGSAEILLSCETQFR
jgi:hypothetical protein